MNIKEDDLSPFQCCLHFGDKPQILRSMCSLIKAMQLWVFLFGTVACVALPGTTPL